jgi:hypothetical protein
MDESIDDVPMALRERLAEIVELTDTFCDQHLNEEYKEICRSLAVEICQEGSPVARGKPASWACGVVYSAGWVNFLTEPSQSPHMQSEAIAEGFGVSVATMQAKSKAIREGLELMPMDPDFCLPSRMEDNPLAWMVEVNGLLVDIRHAPREVQEAAFERGLTPFIPEGNED